VRRRELIKNAPFRRLARSAQESRNADRVCDTPDLRRRACRSNAAGGSAGRLPEVVEKLSSQGFEVSGAGPEEYGAAIRTSLGKWSKVIRAANVRTD
jgi:hypothetical protein